MLTKTEFLRQWIEADAEARSMSPKSWNPTEPGKEFSGTPFFYIFVDMDYFALLQPVAWTPAAYKAQHLLVPRGFVTDFASVPRLFWSLLPPIGRYGYAALFHDYVYWVQKTTRREADDVFRDTMQELSVSKRVAWILYWSVRLFGGFAWRGNRKLKDNGEKRILKRFPIDLKTRWVDWKRNPDIFE